MKTVELGSLFSRATNWLGDLVGIWVICKIKAVIKESIKFLIIVEMKMCIRRQAETGGQGMSAGGLDAFIAVRAHTQLLDPK